MQIKFEITGYGHLALGRPSDWNPQLSKILLAVSVTHNLSQSEYPNFQLFHKALQDFSAWSILWLSNLSLICSSTDQIGTAENPGHLPVLLLAVYAHCSWLGAPKFLWVQYYCWLHRHNLNVHGRYLISKIQRSPIPSTLQRQQPMNLNQNAKA